MYSLRENGFMHYRPDINCSTKDKETLTNEVNNLEKDAYAPTTALRYRRYSNAIIIPWEKDSFYWLPTKRVNGVELSGYDQGTNNPEHNSMRYFNALSPALKKTSFLKDLIINNFNKTFGMVEHYLPIYIGVHLVKIRCADNDFPGSSSPDCFHQDGEPFTFAHLVSRSKEACGGNNYISDLTCRNRKPHEVDEKSIIYNFTLTDFMESFAVCDSMVCHYVDPLSMATPDNPVERTMILIDFSLTNQKI